MKAVVIDGYGGPEKLELREVEPPVPTGSQVLLRVRSASVNPVDWKIRNGLLRPVWPLKFPFILGGDAAGEVEALGPQATRWNAGDAVYCALPGGGAYAEYVAVEETHCARKPERLSWEETAAIPIAGLTALQALRDKSAVKPGQRVLINGASGGVGTFAVQLAAAMRCHVTGVASTRNQDLLRELGADEAIDYIREDFTKQDRRYDVVFDVVPNQSFFTCRRVLNPGGSYITTLPGVLPAAWSAATRLGRLVGYRKRCHFIMMKPKGADLEVLNQYIDAGQLRSIIDQTFPLAELREAHRASEAGHTRGKIAIQVNAG